MAAEIKVKFVNKRINIANESIDMGTVYYCKDTGESFFDEDAIVRISLGTEIVFSSLTVGSLPNLTSMGVGRCAVIVENNTLYTFTEDLKWVQLTSTDELLEIIGAPERFVPHSLYKQGVLLAPRTLMSCVYDDTGIPIGDKLLKLLNWMDNIIYNGIDASMITSGVFNLSLIPKTAMMDYVVVEDTAARLALTIDKVQNGDVVQEVSGTGKAYFVVDETKLGTEAAFKEFTTGSIPWTGVVNRPTNLAIAGGANGAVSLDTSAGSRLVMNNVSLNMAHATEGILSKERGGTGNQNGRAASVDHTAVDKATKTPLSLYNTSTKLSHYDSSAFMQNNILNANAFKAANTSSTTALYNTSICDTLYMAPRTATGSINIYARSYDGSNISPIIIATQSSNALNIGSDSWSSTRLMGRSVSLMVSPTTPTSAVTIEDSAGNVMFKCGYTTTSSSGGTHIVTSVARHDFYNMINVRDTTVSKDYGVLIQTGNLGTIFDTNSSARAAVFMNHAGNFCFRTYYSGSNTNSFQITGDGVDVAKKLRVGTTSQFDGLVTVKAAVNSAGYNIDGYARGAVNATKFGNKSVSDFVLKSEITNAAVSAVVVQSSAPTGRTNCLWVNSSTGVASYWNGSSWVNLSSVWKNA